MYIKVNNASLLYLIAKCKYKYLGFLNFIASLSIRVCINIRTQSLVIKPAQRKQVVTLNIILSIYDTKKYINIAITNMIQRPSNWYSLGMVITGDIVPGQWVLLIAHFLQQDDLIHTFQKLFLMTPPTIDFGLDLNMEVALSYGPNPLQLTQTLNDKRALVM